MSFSCFQPGKSWRSVNCSITYYCHHEKIQSRDTPCGKNTECVESEQGPVCQCIDDHYGNPEMPSGCSKGREEDGKICYDFMLPTGKYEERCNCSKGFISNCSDCEGKFKKSSEFFFWNCHLSKQMMIRNNWEIIISC